MIHVNSTEHQQIHITNIATATGRTSGQEESPENITPPSAKSGRAMINNLDALSMQPISADIGLLPLGLLLDNPTKNSSTTIYVGGTDNGQQDDVSAPTVEGSFSEEDEDFSLMSEKDILSTLEMNLPTYNSEENDDLSLSSINTKALLQITELRKRLRIQENTKLELLNQCLRLESRLEKNDCKHAYLKIYKAENNRLREASAKMERDFMNDMNEIVTKMTMMEKDFREKLKDRDDKIERLEQELHLLKVAKNLDLMVTTHETVRNDLSEEC
jgi:hypothetical protein